MSFQATERLDDKEADAPDTPERADNCRSFGMERRHSLLHGDVTETILAAFFEVYKVLGYGLVETVYIAALVMELEARGLRVRKAGPLFPPYVRLHLHDYLKATNLEVGLLLHCGPKAHFERVYSPNKS